MRRQNPLELVFEDISTFAGEIPIVGSLLRELDIKNKQSDSDFIKSLLSHPGKEFEIKKKLDKLRRKTILFLTITTTTTIKIIIIIQILLDQEVSHRACQQ